MFVFGKNLFSSSPGFAFFFFFFHLKPRGGKKLIFFLLWLCVGIDFKFSHYAKIGPVFFYWLNSHLIFVSFLWRFGSILGLWQIGGGFFFFLFPRFIFGEPLPKGPFSACFRFFLGDLFFFPFGRKGLFFQQKKKKRGPNPLKTYFIKKGIFKNLLPFTRGGKFVFSFFFIGVFIFPLFDHGAKPFSLIVGGIPSF